MKLLWMLLLCSFSCFASNSDVETLKEKLHGPVVGGHMGNFWTFKPNTIPADEETRKNGAQVVEMDLHLTKDGVAIVYHDDTLDRWTTCKGPIYEKTWEELQKCHFWWRADVGIPKYEDVLKWSQGRMIINAEFKELRVIPEALRLAKQYNCYSWCYFQTQGDKAKYFFARQTDPNIALLFSPKNIEDLIWSVGLVDDNLIIIELDDRFKDLKLATTIAHSSGRLVSVDSFDYSYSYELFGATCDTVFKAGVDIAITNRPKSCLNQRLDFVGKK